MKNKIIIITVAILQSCTVYHKPTANLEEAVGKGKVKVVSNYGQTLKLDKIVQKDSVYYGISQNDTVQIRSKDLSKIQLADKRKSHEFKNRVFITAGFTPHMPMPIDAYQSYGSYGINYERKLNNYFSSRLSYGRSFKSQGIAGESFNREDHSDAQRSFYMTTLGFTTHKNNSHLEVNIGYALIHVEEHLAESYQFGFSYLQESHYLHSPVVEVGYRLTMGQFMFRNGVSWPYGRYMSIGYAF